MSRSADLVPLERARRIALAAQGFASPRPARVTRTHIRSMLKRLHLLQIDSVNVVVRAHYMPLFSRLGPYDRDLLDTMAYRDRELFEYWGHEASLIRTELFPLFRPRMRPHPHPRMQAWIARSAALIEQVLGEVRTRGPLGVGDLTERGPRAGPWWGWSDAKTALEHLFQIGAVTAAGRRNFERLYDLTERVLPAGVLEGAPPPRDEANLRLLELGARALGIGTARDIADYFRIPMPVARPLIARLVEQDELRSVRVEGWREPAYVHPEAKAPRAVAARALLAPFDPVVWERARAERLFGFHYRIEIYVPQPKRVYGYYVFPFLLDEDIVARVDLKADRAARTLRVRAAWLEPGRDAERVAASLADELRTMAAWLSLDDVAVERAGTLARALRAAVR